MFGFLVLQAENKHRHAAVQCGTKTICGVRFFAVTVAQSRSVLLQKRRLRKAAKLMERSGVHTALFPEGFCDTAVFRRYGVQEAGEDYLRRMTAGAIARRALAEQGRNPAECRAALLGDCMDVQLRAALMEIALHVRYTMLNAGGNGAEICSVLRREYGVSVLRDAGEEQLRQADLVLTFGGGQPCGAPGCLWLPFGSVTEAEGYQNGALRVEYALPPELEEQVQADCCRNALLSLLLEMGAVHANELEVTEIMQNA